MVLKNIIKKLLDYLQSKNNQKYEKDGLTDEVLERQVEINEYRNRYDITDDDSVISDNEGFVQ